MRKVILFLLLFSALSLPVNAERVTRVVDGDTIVLDDGRRVRYIGVNTPEVHHPRLGAQPGGREAAAKNRELVAGRSVRLEYDVQPTDRYGRSLAYVYVGQMMVNAEMVRRGYAQVMTVPPNVRHQDLFLSLQREAREAGRGLWAEPDAAAVLANQSQTTHRKTTHRRRSSRRIAERDNGEMPSSVPAEEAPSSPVGKRRQSSPSTGMIAAILLLIVISSRGASRRRR